MPLLSLVVPTYNERDNIVPLLDAVRAAMAGRELEVWVVDDDSPDLTWQLASQYAQQHPEVSVIRRVGARGLSAAVVEGFEKCRGDLLAVIDADLSHDPDLLPKLADAVADGAAVAVGSRRIVGGSTENWTWHRRKTSDVATRLARWWLHVPLSDPMSGYFVLRRSVYQAVRGKMHNRGYKILLEIVCCAGETRLAEIPYTFKDRRQGVSKLSVRVMAQFLKSLWELRGARKSAG